MTHTPPVWCTVHGKWHRKSDGCPECRSAPSITPEETAKEAVIEAAEKYNDAACGMERTNAMTAIHRTVKTLRASRKPKGVKPEEVEAMTQFRFVSGAGDRVYLLLKDLGQRRYFNEYGQLLYFAPSSRIIPIDPEDS